MWNDNGDGGFDTSNNMFASPTQDEQKQSSNKPRCMAPVTIKQVIECPEDGLRVKGIDIQMVEICGIIKAVEVSSIKITYTVEDDTGEITGAFYTEDSAETSIPVSENMYCIMVGSIKSQANEKHIMVFNIRPVSRLETFQHALAVMHMDLKADCLSKEVEIKQEKMRNEALSSNRFGSDQVSFDMEPKFKRVYDIITRSRSENGVSIIELSNSLPVKMDEIRSALEYLIAEGHIFTTIDDNHFKSTDGGF